MEGSVPEGYHFVTPRKNDANRLQEKGDDIAEKQLLRWPKPTKEAQIKFREYAHYKMLLRFYFYFFIYIKRYAEMRGKEIEDGRQSECNDLSKKEMRG